MPTGAGVTLSIVEAGGSDQIYFPDSSIADFNASGDPFGLAVNFIDASGKMANGISDHATNQARTILGNDGLTPGSNEVTIYEANDWLLNFLRYSGVQAPVAQDFQVQNHSWVGTLATGTPTPPPHTPHSNNVEALRRYDYLLETANLGAGITAAVGLNNNTNPVPFLLSSTYNTLAVGRSDGQHSAGLTLSGVNSYGPGRGKPDLVAPRTTTSAATSVVSGTATLLYDALANTNGTNNETVKAILLAGASKSNYDYTPKFASWTNSPTQPLDDTFGAGELNIYNSFVIEQGGQQVGRRIHTPFALSNNGWDYKNFKRDKLVEDIYYRIDIQPGMAGREFSAVLSWNVEVVDQNDNGNLFDPQESLQNLDLALYDSTGGFLNSLVAESISSLDNVEHIYIADDPETSAFEGLAPGSYTLRVSGSAEWDFGVAWRTTSQHYDFANSAYVFDADFNDDDVVDGGDLLIWQRNSGIMLGATNNQGDADGDGDVDENDLWATESSFGAATFVASSLAIGAVPEPAALALAALGIAAILLARAQQRRRTNARTDAFVASSDGPS